MLFGAVTLVGFAAIFLGAHLSMRRPRQVKEVMRTLAKL